MDTFVLNCPPRAVARTKCITMEKNYDFFVRHLAQLLNSGLNALQKKAPFITKKVMDLVLFLIGRLKPLLFYFVILEKVMDLVVYLFGRLNALLFWGDFSNHYFSVHLTPTYKQSAQNTFQSDCIGL